MSVSRFVHILCLAASLAGVAAATPAGAQARPARFLAKEDILLYGIGLKVEPAQQTVPKDIATIVSTYLQAAAQPDGLPPFAPDAEVRATLVGPSFSSPRELVTRPNTAFQIPPLTVPGVHTLENIRLVSNGEVLLYGSPQSVRIEAIERLLVTQVTARPLSAAEIREKGIVFDKTSFQAYNFSAAFAIQDKKINLNFPVLLPSLQGAADQSNTQVQLQTIAGAQLPSLSTIIPDTLRIQTQVPNLSVVGFTLKAPTLQGQQLVVPPIPGVVVIPGDIGFLNQFFSVMLMVGNVAPAGSNLVVSDMKAEIVLPAGNDGVVGSGDDPLRMARTNGGESPRIVRVVQPGFDAKLGTADDIVTIGPGETGNAEYLVEGRREGSHVVEMQISATLNGLPVGPVPITGRAAGAVLVRNPTFTLTFTHPEVVSAGEPYSLDVTVTNTSASPANLVSLNLYPRNVSGATIVGDATRQIDSIAPGDSTTVSFDLISKITGKVTAATLDSTENVAGRFALKTAVGELNVPLSPDSLVLPKEASSLPRSVRDAAIGLLGKAWAVATAPPAAMPPDLSAFSRKIVLDRAVEVAEAGLRVSLREPLPDSAAQLAMDFVGSNYSRLATLVKPADLDFEQTNFRGFDEVRRKSLRGDAFAAAVAGVLADSLTAQGATAFHQHLAERWSYRPAHVSILAAGANGGLSPYDVSIVDASGRRVGGISNGKVIKEIPFADLLTFTTGDNAVTAQLAVLAAPAAGALTVRLAPRDGVAPGTPALISVVLPDASGGLRQVVYQVGAQQVPAPIAANGGPISVAFALDGAAPVPPVSSSAIVDPPPTVISVIQQADADQIRCDPEKPGFRAGRIVAVLFSEEVTPQSVQDRLAAQLITNYAADANQVVGVALQPGRRIAFIALRDPLGPFIARNITIHDVADPAGHVMAPWTGPMEATVDQDGAVVSGHVLDASGKPMPFADVRLFYLLDCGLDEPQWVGIASKPADANGFYSWDYVAKPLLNRILAVDTATDDFRNVQYNVQRQGQRLNVDIVFLGRGSIEGTARSEQGAPLFDTAIRITSLTDQSQYSARTDLNGHYSVARVPVGNVFIEAVNVAANAQVSQSDYIPSAGSVVQRDLTLLDVEKQKITVKHGTIHGFVFRDDGVTPAGGLPVFAYYRSNSQQGVSCPPGPSPCAIARTTTGADGAYSFVDITAGELSVSSFDQTGLSKAEVGLVLPANGTATANLLLSGGLGTVTGKVLTGDGQPVNGAQVGGGLSLTTTNALGEFTLVDVPVGHREIVAVSQTLAASGRSTIDIVRPGETVATTIVFDAQGTIAGRVVEADGTTPVVGVTVYAFQPIIGGTFAIVGSAVTTAQGGYSIPHVPAGTYKVSAFNAGFTDGNIISTAVKFNGQTSRADIKFRGGAGKVTGVVYNDTGNTPLKARVGVSGDRVRVAGGLVGVSFERVENFSIADSDLTTGRFALSGVFVGPFTLNAVGQFSPDPISVEGVIPSPGATVNIDLRLQATSQIRGVVTNPDGTPAAADVVVHYKSEEYKLICTEDALGEQQCDSIPQGIQEENVVTDNAGRFWLPVVNAGSFTLSVEDPQTGKVGQVKGSVRPGETAEVPVRLLAQGSVQVRVLGSDTTTPIPGAKVVVKQLGYPQVRRELIADGSGIATFTGGDGLSEGDFVVEATDLRNGFAGRASGRITVDGTEVVTKVYLFNASGSVQGVVYGADGFTPVPNADVVVANAQGPLAFAVTGPDGAYSLDQVPLGDVNVEVFDARSGRRGNGSGRIDFNGEQVPVNVVLAAVGVVKGLVLDNATRGPLKGWTVTLQQRSASGVSLPTLTSTTGVDGRFLIPGAGRGTFTLVARRNGISGSGSASGALDQEGQIVDVPMLVTIARTLTGTITGTVLTSTGAPAASTIVDVCAQCGSQPTTLTTDAFGAFSLDNAPLGRFTVRARSQVSHDAGSGVGELRTDGDVATVVVAMEGVAQVTGTVERADGSVVAGAQVVFDGFPASACGIDGCISGTDNTGHFSFIDQPARSFTVTATDPISKLKGSAGGPLTAGENRVVRIVLAPTAALSGRVLTAAGQGASGIVAELIAGENTPSERRLYKQTLADGTFTFPAAPLEAYRLVLADPVGSGIASRSGQLTATTSLGDIVLDEAPPTVASLTPQASATAVPLRQAITVVFSEPIQPGTINPDHVRLTGPAGAVTATLDVSANDTTVVLTPLTPLTAETRYTLRIAGVTDRVGKVMAADYTAAFTTVDLTAPSLAEASPAANTGGVTIYTPIRIRFSEPIDPSKFASAPITLTGPSGAVAGRLDYLTGNTVLVFTPNLPLVENAAYQVQIAAATDAAGNRQATGTSFQFSTTDRTPPTIAALVPGNNGKVIENGTTTVSAELGATNDVLFVDFYVNGTLAFVDRQAPFALAFQATPQVGAAGSVITISAIATDTSGNRGVLPATTTVTVIPDQAPAVAITAPAAQLSAKNGDHIVVSVRATDDLGVKAIGYRAQTGNPANAVTRDIAPPSGDRTETFAFDVPADAEPGSVIQIEASAIDTFGHVVSAVPATVTVIDAVSPTVTITGATTGARVAPGQQTTVIVTATDKGGVSSIAFAASGVVTANESRTVNPAQNSVVTSFTVQVPATAQPGQSLMLDATAIDRAGNSGAAARVILPVADSKPPVLTLSTENGTLTAVPGRTVRVVATATDETGVTRVNLSTTGAVTFADAKQVTPPLNSAVVNFDIPVPANAAPGSTIAIQATATDISDQTSAPVTLTLTVTSAVDVILPASEIVDAGQERDITVQLGAPAAAGGVTVTFTSANSDIVTVPPSLTFAAGEAAKTLTLSGVAGGTTQVRALINGVERATMTVTVAGGIVSGIVRDSLLVPVVGAHVTVTSGASQFSAISDGSGRYTVSGVNGPHVDVRVTDPVTKLYGHSTGDMAHAQGVVGVNVVLIPAGAIAGHVTDASGTVVGAGVKVEIFNSNGGGAIATTFTTDAGTFEFPLVTLGNYMLQATSGLNRGRASVSLATSGQQLETTVVYLGAGTVSGTVRLGGVAVANAKLTFESWSIFGGSTPIVTNAQANGTFSFSGVPIGSFTITAEDPATTQKGSATGEITVNGQSVTANVNLSAYGAVTGLVRRADGTTIVAGALVTIAGPDYRRQGTTDENGRYRFDVVPLGAYTLSASDAGTRGGGTATVNVDTHQATKTADITFVPQGRLLVTVLNAGGQPVSSAFVRVDVNNGSAQDTLTATTGGDGTVLIDHVLAGSYIVTANFGSLGGVTAGTLTANVLTNVTVSLEPTGSLTGTVFEPNGQTPVAGARVTILGQGVVTTNADGVYRMDALTAGRYDIVVTDSQNRVRAKTDPYNSNDDLVLSGNGQVVTRDFSMIGLGTVTGRVVFSANGQSAGNTVVSLSVQAAGFEGARSVRTDAGGFYTFEDVAAGPVSVVVSDTVQRLYGEASGTLPQHGATLTLDVSLTSNAITLPKYLWDANNSLFDIQAAGNVNTGSGSLLAGDSNTNRGAFSLDVVRNGAATPFVGGEVPTIEDGNREVVVRQENLAGLSVTRKVFVPRAGYFARYLEILRNPTANPITVDLRVRGNVTGTDVVVDRTSSGDAVLDVSNAQSADTWFVAGRSDAAAAAFVVDGTGAARHVDELSLTPAQTGATKFGKVVYRWNGVTVPAGGTVAIMHFGVQQLSRAAATASAERLAGLPPEALAGLSTDELAAIANFAVPADGQSALAPLPPVTGAVTGKVLEADKTTTVASAGVSLRSTHPLFGGTYTVNSAADGTFTIAGVLRDNGNSVAIPVAGFTIAATYPVTGVASPQSAGAIDPQTLAAVQNIEFSNTGALFGNVVRHNGAAVVSGTVEIAGGTPATSRTVAIAADATYRVGGLPPGAYTLSASTNDPKGTGLAGAATATVAAGPAVRADITMQTTGTLTGVVHRSGGTLASGITVSVQRDSFSRQTTTDSGGGYTFANMPTGTFTVTATEPGTGITTSAPVTIATDATTTQDLSLVVTGRVVGVVTLDGEAQPGLQVSLRSTNPQAGGFAYQTTDAGGAFTFPSVPVGAFTVTVFDTTRQLYGDASGRIQSDGEEVAVTITLVDNAISLPAYRYDANNFTFDIQRGGQIGAGSYGAFGTSTAEGAALLQIDNGTGPVTFTGAPAGTYEDGGREIATRQSNVGGLDVTRKVFVPREGYFARYLEILSNPSSSPVTVKVAVRSRVGWSGWNWNCYCTTPQVPAVVTTSSGDTTFNPATAAGDKWLTLAYGNDVDPFVNGNIPPVAFVLGGADAPLPASAGSYTTPDVGLLNVEWQNVTIPAGGTTAFMHFVVQQTSRAGALAAAQRLAQLPPEALSGLSEVEIAAIRNFAVAPTGTSTLDPLPSLTGTVQGRALASDGTALVPGATVVFRSDNPLFRRTQTATADWTTAAFSFTGAFNDYGQSIAVPAGPFSLTVTHPTTSASASTSGTFAAGQTAATKDVALTGTANVSVLVTTNDGTPINGAALVLDGYGYQLWTNDAGRAVFTGLTAGSHTVSTWRNPVYPQAGGPLEVAATVQPAVDSTATVTLAYPAVGQITGRLLTASGGTVAGGSVTITNPATSWGRVVPTTSGGVFTLTDLPEGIYRLSAVDPVNGAPVDVQAVIIGGQTTTQDLTLPGTSTLTVTVKFARGVVAANSRVDISHAGTGGSFYSQGNTNALGQLTIANVPVGPFTVRANYPGNSGYWTDALGTVTANGGSLALTVTLPGLGGVHGTLTTAKGAPVANRWVQLRRAGTDAYFTDVYTDQNGNFQFTGVPLEQSFHVATLHQSVYGLWKYSDDFTLHTDGEDPRIDISMPAVSSVTVQVKRADNTGWSGLRVERKDRLQTYFDVAGSTNSSGELTLTSVPEGSFTVRVRDVNSGVVIGERTGTIAQSDDGAVIAFPIPVSATIGTVKGRVLAADGVKVLNGVKVAIYDAGENKLLKSMTTGADGSYQFADVLSGPQGMFVRATSPNNSSVVVNQPVSIGTAGQTVTVDVVLPVIVGTVKGVVTAATGGTLLANADVHLIETGASGDGIWVQTNASGAYQIADVALSGPFTVTAIVSGQSLAKTASFTSQGQTVTLDFTLPITVGSLQGTVYGGDGATALPDVWVAVSTTTGQFLTSGYTDAVGHYSFPSVYAPGSLVLMATVSDVAPVTATVDFTAVSNVTRDLVVPASVVRGHVAQADGTAVSDLEVFVEASDLNVWQPYTSPTNGNYLVVGAPAGGVRITVQDRTSGLRRVVSGTLPDVVTPLIADVALPGTGTITGTITNTSGAVIPSLSVRVRSDLMRYEQYPSSNNQGVYTLAGVPEGPVMVSGEVWSSGKYTYLSGTGTVTRGATVTINVTPVPTGQVSGRVLAADGTPVANADVEIISFYDDDPFDEWTQSDANGVFTMNNVPAAPVYLTAWGSSNRVGKAEGTLTGGAVLQRDITFGSAVDVSYTLTGDDGFKYQVANGGELRTGGSVDGTSTSPYNWSIWLEVNGDYFCCSYEAALGLNGRQVTVGPLTTDVLAASRSVYVPSSGGFARYLEVLYNPTAIARTVTVYVGGYPASGSRTRWVVKPAATSFRYAVSDDGFNATPTRASVGYVMAGTGPVASKVTGTEFTGDGSNHFAFQYTVTVPAHQRVGVLHFELQRAANDAAGADAAAQALSTLSDPNALTGLTAAEKAMIVNFVIAP